MDNETLDFLYDDEDDFEKEEETEKPSVFQSIFGWIKRHGTTILIAVIPAVIKALLARKEYDNYIYTTDADGKIYKLPAREMRTIHGTKNKIVQSEITD